MITDLRIRQSILVVITMLVILAAVGLAFGLLGAASGDFLANWWLPALPIPLVLIGMHYRETLSLTWRSAWIGLMLTMVLLFVLISLQIVVSNITVKPEWDLKWFWLHARAAAQGMNFYQAELVHQLAAQYAPNTDLFLSQLYFWYPPPTMLYMLPLGWFDMETAFTLWQIVHLVLLVVDIVILRNLFLPKSGWIGLLFVGALVAGLHPVIDTIYAGQTNFLMLFFILLYWRDRERPRAGIWIVAAAFVKPFVGILLLVVLIRRQWKVLGVMVVSAAVAALVSILVFGLPTFISYFTENPVANLNSYMLTMPFNQSLLATLLRLGQVDVSGISPFTYPPFLVGALILTAITVVVVYRLGTDKAGWGIALTLLLGVLIYPHSLRYYSLVLILPILLIWSDRTRFFGQWTGAIIALSLVYELDAYRPGSMIFFVLLACWIIAAIYASREAHLFSTLRKQLNPSHT
ncbi:MAG: glycosyltransferase family 87 protein [Chloroflexota bacterium]